MAVMKGNIELETNARDNIIKLILKRMDNQGRIDLEAVKQFMSLSSESDQSTRMSGYAGVLDALNADAPPSPVESVEKTPAPKEHPPVVVNIGEQQPKKRGRRAIRITRPDGSQSLAEVLDMDEPQPEAGAA
jgi:hypothetical protein